MNILIHDLCAHLDISAADRVAIEAAAVALNCCWAAELRGAAAQQAAAWTAPTTAADLGRMTATAIVEVSIRQAVLQEHVA